VSGRRSEYILATKTAERTKDNCLKSLDQSLQNLRTNFPETQSELLPLAQLHNTAVILMKPVGDGLLWRSDETAFRYAFSQPVSIVVAGINNLEILKALIL
jgi:aryl-alcohol dehydrogenase-like predicted oxidoreductase